MEALKTSRPCKTSVDDLGSEPLHNLLPSNRLSALKHEKRSEWSAVQRWSITAQALPAVFATFGVMKPLVPCKLSDQLALVRKLYIWTMKEMLCVQRHLSG